MSNFRKIFISAFDEISQLFTSLINSLQNNPAKLIQSRQKGLQNLIKSLSEEFHRVHFLELIPAIGNTILRLRFENGALRLAKMLGAKTL